MSDKKKQIEEVMLYVYGAGILSVIAKNKGSVNDETWNDFFKNLTRSQVKTIIQKEEEGFSFTYNPTGQEISGQSMPAAIDALLKAKTDNNDVQPDDSAKLERFKNTFLSFDKVKDQYSIYHKDVIQLENVVRAAFERYKSSFTGVKTKTDFPKTFIEAIGEDYIFSQIVESVKKGRKSLYRDLMNLAIKNGSTSDRHIDTQSPISGPKVIPARIKSMNLLFKDILQGNIQKEYAEFLKDDEIVFSRLFPLIKDGPKSTSKDMTEEEFISFIFEKEDIFSHSVPDLNTINKTYKELYSSNNLLS